MAQRSVLRSLLKNFIDSLKPRPIRGTVIGKDYFGNTYYEMSSGSGKRPSRWFEPKDKEDFDQEIPAEWEAWLRGRRKVPPKEEEIMKNLSIMEMKKKNAAELEKKYAAERNQSVQKELEKLESFPKYDDYEIMPGKPQDKKV